MSLRTRTPALLEPFLQLPPELSLTLITGTLGCSPTWLLSSFITNLGNEVENDVHILLASWTRDRTFWKRQGIDFVRHKITFIDCLETSLQPPTKDMATEILQTTASAAEKLISKAGKVVLLLDQPDVLLATAAVTSHQLATLVLKLRRRVHATVLTCSADLPLLSATQHDATPSASPLESECASFISQQAHAAHLIFSCRELATGAARDVSGVLRITPGAGADSEDEYGSLDGSLTRDFEVLYLVNRDGSVKVFQRGAHEA